MTIFNGQVFILHNSLGFPPCLTCVKHFCPGEILSKSGLQEKEGPEDWIEYMEEHLLKSIDTIKANVMHLIKMCYPLLEDRMKSSKKSTGS